MVYKQLEPWASPAGIELVRGDDLRHRKRAKACCQRRISPQGPQARLMQNKGAEFEGRSAHVRIRRALEGVAATWCGLLLRRASIAAPARDSCVLTPARRAGGYAVQP